MHQIDSDYNVLLKNGVPVSKATNFFDILIPSTFWLGWFTAYLADVFLTMQYGPYFKARFYQGSHVITLNLALHLKARYASYHHRQSLFKKVRQYSLYLKISIFSIFPYLRNVKHAILKWS